MRKKPQSLSELAILHEIVQKTTASESNGHQATAGHGQDETGAERLEGDVDPGGNNGGHYSTSSLSRRFRNKPSSDSSSNPNRCVLLTLGFSKAGFCYYTWNSNSLVLNAKLKLIFNFKMHKKQLKDFYLYTRDLPGVALVINSIKQKSRLLT